MTSRRSSQDAVRRLEEAVDIITDMGFIRRSRRYRSDEEARMEISPALVKEAIEGFSLFDKASKQGLDVEELAIVFRALGQNPTDADIRRILREHDLNGNGLLERDEFEHMLLSYMKPMGQVEQELKDAFRVFDKNGDGVLDTTELEKVLKRYGEPLTHPQARELIKLMDKDGNGKVDMNDFVKFLCEVDQPDYFQKNYPACSGETEESEAAF